MTLRQQGEALSLLALASEALKQSAGTGHGSALADNIDEFLATKNEPEPKRKSGDGEAPLDGN